MSEHHKMDTNKYPNIFGGHIKYQANIRIYSDAMYLPNKYINIFAKQIYEYICTPEIAHIQIQIILEGNFIRIFKYSYSSLIEEVFEKGSLMLLLNIMLY